MSFQTNMASIMKADASLNKLVSGIHFDILPVNFDLIKDWVVFNYVESERFDVMGQKNYLTTYTLYVKVISPDTFNLLNISDELNKYLTNYTSSNVLDISYSTDNHSNSIVDDTDIFENLIEYTITYQK
jgi:hypothetical protein